MQKSANSYKMLEDGRARIWQGSAIQHATCLSIVRPKWRGMWFARSGLRSDPREDRNFIKDLSLGGMLKHNLSR